ncbi:ATP-binding protein [bacterium]|nr:ATP-binding protein [bacterium]
MKESITIHNFGPIKYIHIKEIKPVMLLIGRSATGKSTIMKLIGLFRYLYKYANIASYLKQSKIASLPFKKQFKKLIEANGLATNLKSDTHLTYTVEEGEGRTYKIEYRPGRPVSLPSISPEDLTFIKGIFVSEFRNIISAWTGYGPNSGLQLGFYFNETLELFKEAVRTNPSVDLPYFGMTFKASKTASNGMPQYNLVTKNSEGKEINIRLRDASSGMKTTTPLGLIVNYASHSFDFTEAFQRSVIDLLYRSNRLKEFKAVAELKDLRKMVTISIEEPELSLDPETQGLLLDYIVTTLFHINPEDGRNFKIMMASHSPYMANQLNLLMARNEVEATTGINPKDVEVLLTENGTARSLMVRDDHNRPVVDTEFLSDPINQIYDNYESLRPD